MSSHLDSAALAAGLSVETAQLVNLQFPQSAPIASAVVTAIAPIKMLVRSRTEAVAA